jgi:hypothetical protein
MPPHPCTPPHQLQEALAVTVDAMRAYFLPVRFYSRYYPYMGFRSAMVHIALERTREVGAGAAEFPSSSISSNGSSSGCRLSVLPDAGWLAPVHVHTPRTPCSTRPCPADAAHRRQHGPAGGRGSGPAQRPPQPSPGGTGTLVWFGQRWHAPCSATRQLLLLPQLALPLPCVGVDVTASTLHLPVVAIAPHNF